MLLLLRRKVLPGFHALENAFPFLRRTTVEALQALAELFLFLQRQALELRVVLKRLLLLVGRQIPILAQPVAGMRSRSTWSCGWRARGGWRLSFRSSLGSTFLTRFLSSGAAPLHPLQNRMVLRLSLRWGEERQEQSAG